MGTLQRLFVTVITVLVLALPGFGSAIVSGFNTTSDGHNDDGTYTSGGCNNDAPGGTCSGTLIPIGFTVNFFGSNHNSLYINTNGNITFDSPLPTFTPFGLDDALRSIIAPFFADIDTRNPASGVVTFGSGTFDGRGAFGVNWLDVGYFEQHVDKTNEFQLLLVDRNDTGSGNFDIVFNYDRILFETGDASFGFEGLGGLSARAGISNGTGKPGESIELAGSGIPGSFVDGGPRALVTHSLNSSVPGRYIFNARNGDIVVIPEPSTYILLLGGGIALFFRRSLSNC